MAEAAAPSDGNISDDDSWMSLRGSDVELADQDEVISIITEENQWQFVDTEETELPNETDILKAAEARAREVQADGTSPSLTPSSSHCSFVDLTKEQEEEEEEEKGFERERDLFEVVVGEKGIDLEAAKVQTLDLTSEVAATGGNAQAIAAGLLAIDPLRVLACGGGAAEIDDSCRGNVTSEWATALAAFPSVAGAFCVGRLCLATSASAVVLARVAVVNSSSDDWPEETALRLVAGEAHGLAEFPIGGLSVGQGADLHLDLHVTAPPDAGAGRGQRSGWVLSDGLGRPFGPLVVFEVMWI